MPDTVVYEPDHTFPSVIDMVSNHGHHTDAYVKIMQGTVLSNVNQLPKLIWNQIKVLIVANKDGKSRSSDLLYALARSFRVRCRT